MTRYLTSTFSTALLAAALLAPAPSASACAGCGCSTAEAPSAAATGHKHQGEHKHDHAHGDEHSGSNSTAAASVGEAAPAFRLMDQSGEPVALSDFAGQPVVVEFFNDQCPFVKKFYENGDMNRLAEQAADEYGAAWIAIDASSFSNVDENAAIAEEWGIERPLLDGSAGDVGQQFGAKTTPHMYVIDGEGTLVYAGAIDSEASTDSDDIAGATNYVMQALAELKDGTAISTPETKAYGCSVKY